VSWRGSGPTELLGLALISGLAVAGCGGSADNHVPQDLTVLAQWNDSPSAVDQIGYQLWVDLLWPDRRQGCYALSPNLAIHIDDDIVVAPPIEGDCAYESLVIVNGVATQGSTTVSLRDGDQVLGEGTFGGLFPSTGATLVTPAAGQPVKAGDPFAIALPTPASPSSAGARFYWTNLPAGVPPFYSFTSGTLSADGSTFQGTAPTTTGQAIVAVEGIFGQGNYVAATSCTGFQYCNGLPSFDVAGPVSIEVDP
jgi:hypothetical protein